MNNICFKCKHGLTSFYNTTYHHNHRVGLLWGFNVTHWSVVWLSLKLSMNKT